MQSDVLRPKGCLRKSQQVGLKQHLQRLINYGLTDAAVCGVQSRGLENTAASPNPIFNTKQV